MTITCQMGKCYEISWKTFEAIREAYYQDFNIMDEFTVSFRDSSRWIGVEVVTRTGRVISYVIRDQFRKKVKSV